MTYLGFCYDHDTNAVLNRDTHVLLNRDTHILLNRDGPVPLNRDTHILLNRDTHAVLTVAVTRQVRWEPSVVDGTDYRTMVIYKDSQSNVKLGIVTLYDC